LTTIYIHPKIKLKMDLREFSMSFILSGWVLLLLKPTLEKSFIYLGEYLNLFEVGGSMLIGIYLICVFDYLRGSRQLISK
jgi:hypothetical protein